MCKKLIFLISFVLLLSMATTATAVDPNLVAHWKLDETSGTTADNDEGTSSYDGTLTNGVDFGNDSVAGAVSSALQFDGSDDYINASVSQPTTNFSLSTWFKSDNALDSNSTRINFVYWGGSTALAFNEESETTGEITFRIRPGGTMYYDVDTTTTTWDANTWYHIVGTFDGTDGKIYVNSVLEETKTHAGTLDASVWGPHIGCESGVWWPFDGAMDDIRIYDKALSQSEVNDIYNLQLDRRATNPSPADSAADVTLNPYLSWTTGFEAADTNGHAVYFGTSFSNVNTATTASSEYMGAQSSTTYDLGWRDPNTTYYWRIDEVNSSHGDSPWTGGVWSFTTEDYGTTRVISGASITASAHGSDWGPPSGAARVVDGAGLTGDVHDMNYLNMWVSDAEPNGYDNPNPGTIAGPGWFRCDFDQLYSLSELWGWNLNNGAAYLLRGFRKVTIEYSTTGGTDSSEWTELGDYEFAKAPALSGYAHNTTADLANVLAKYVVITANSVDGNWGAAEGVYGLSELRFYQTVPYATNLSPADGQESMDTDVTLSWTASELAADTNGHDVYFGTSQSDVSTATTASSEYMGAQSTTSYSAQNLTADTTYYWRIDEVNGSDIIKSQVINFTVWLDNVVPVVGVTAASEDPWGAEGRLAVKTVDGSGLNNYGEHSTVGSDCWLSDANGGGDVNVNPGTVTGATWLRYDLDTIHELDEMWLWNSNQSGESTRGLKDVTIEYSTTGGSDSSDWTELGDYELTIASGESDYMHDDEISFSNASVKYVVITANDTNGNWGYVSGEGYFYGLAEIRFFATSNYATVPSPADGSDDEAVDTTLGWTAGVLAAETDGHDVYFGTSQSDVSNATTSSSQYKGRQTATSYNIWLNGETAYYWRIDEVNTSEGGSPWTGEVWSFTTTVGEATNPRPDDESYGLGRWLKWTGGGYAADTNGHDVYVGTSFADVNGATTASSQYMGRQSGVLYSTAGYNDGNGLDLESQYFWRIDEVNSTGVAYTGTVWDFVNRRRVIYNSDGWGVWLNAGGLYGNLDQAKWLANIFDQLEDTHVDTLFWGSADEGETTRYDSDAFEHYGVYTSNEDPDLVAMYADGNDPPELVIAEAHARGIEVFYSYRINGCDWIDENIGSIRHDNHDWLLDPNWNDEWGKLSPYGYTFQFNFDVCDVRVYKYNMIEEVATKYDFDGIEIDFMRCVPYFIPDGNEWEHASTLTAFLSDVRTRLNEIGAARGRKFQLAVRVDETIEICKLDGFDVNSWVDQGLVDIISMGSSALDINVADFTAITAGTDVKVYPCLYGYPAHYYPHLSDNMAYALATNYWYQGGDGIYLFNWYSFLQTGNDVEKLARIGNADDLIGKDKMYAADRREEPPTNSYPHNWLHVTLPNDINVADMNYVSIPMLVGEDIDGTYAPIGVELRIECDGNSVSPDPNKLDPSDTFIVKINGNTLTGSNTVDEYLIYYPTAAQVSTGENTIYIEVTAGAVGLEGITLDVNYHDDQTAPIPDPMTFASEPNAISSSAINMTATTATDDANTVQYYFECTTDGNFSSSWQSSTAYEANGLSVSTSYTFKVKARDESFNNNETDFSDPCSATTGASITTLIDGESFEGTWPPSGWSETGNWNNETAQVYDNTYSADFDGAGGGGRSGDLTTPDLDCSDASQITVTFYGYDQGADDTEYYIDYYDGSSWDQIQRLDNFGEGAWTQYSDTITDSQYFKSTFKVRWRAISLDGGEHVYVDLVTITKE